MFRRGAHNCLGQYCQIDRTAGSHNCLGSHVHDGTSCECIIDISDVQPHAEHIRDQALSPSCSRDQTNGVPKLPTNRQCWCPQANFPQIIHSRYQLIQRHILLRHHFDDILQQLQSGCVGVEQIFALHLVH